MFGPHSCDAFSAPSRAVHLPLQDENLVAQREYLGISAVASDQQQTHT